MRNWDYLTPEQAKEELIALEARFDEMIATAVRNAVNAEREKLRYFVFYAEGHEYCGVKDFPDLESAQEFTNAPKALWDERVSVIKIVRGEEVKP